MIAVQLTSSSPLLRTPERSAAAIERQPERTGILATDGTATPATQFQPLDPGIVSDTIPAFFIGRNKDGFWVARDAKGQIGGIFLIESSALSFARTNSRPAGCATIVLSERFELDLVNNGNPLVPYLGAPMQLARRSRRQIAAFIGRLAEAVERRLNDLHIL
jgi:hypothetical protein